MFNIRKRTLSGQTFYENDRTSREFDTITQAKEYAIDMYRKGHR